VPYVALLRGVNVGGRNLLPMAGLRASIADRGIPEVTTYLASGNVICRVADEPGAGERVREVVTTAIAEDHGIDCSVLVRSGRTIGEVADAIPEPWRTDPAIKCDVLYLFPDIDRPDVLAELPMTKVDTALYTPGAVILSVPVALRTRSGLPRIVGTPLYPRVTIRNVRTATALGGLVQEGSLRSHPAGNGT
jgi:uncharacterized protein (DUF1697 family)